MPPGKSEAETLLVSCLILLQFASTPGVSWLIMPTLSKSKHYLISSKDKVAFLVFCFGGLLDVWYEVFVVSAYYQERRQISIDTSSCFNYFLGVALFFAYVQVFWNLYYVTTADNRVSTYIHIDYQQLGDGCSINCDQCESAVIPLSHHCKICDVCILRRDHHCWFAGNCIGLKNQRYFVVLILYLWLGAVIETIYNFNFVTDVLGNDVYTVVSLVTPHCPILLREYSMWCFFVNTMTSLGAILLILLSMLFYAQVMQLMTGLTKHERSYGTIRPVPTSAFINITSTLGRRWYLVWLAPVIISEPGETHLD